MSRYYHNAFRTLLFTFLISLLAPPSHALNIVFTDIGATPMTTEQLAAFEAAAATWESRLSDPITVDINIMVTPLDGLLGATLPAKTTHVWPTAVLAMLLDADSAEEGEAIAGLNGTVIPVVDINGLRNSGKVSMTSANAKALGLPTGRDPTYTPFPANGADGRIKLDSQTPFDFDRSDGIDVDSYDAETIILHEIGHVLGFVSQTDRQDDNPTFAFPPFAQDIWRFTASSSTHRWDTEGRILTAEIAEYDDSVATVEMSHGIDLADCGAAVCGAEHFLSPTTNLMAEFLDKGVRNPQPMDLHVLDYIGWDRSPLPNLTSAMTAELIPVFDPSTWRLPPNLGGASYPPPLPMAPGSVGFTPNVGAVLQIDFGRVAGEPLLGGKRTLFGYMELRPQTPIDVVAVAFPETAGGWERVDTEGEPMRALPPRICRGVFQSDASYTSFRATAIESEYCAQFETGIGEYGGWRVPFCLDGRGDDSGLDDCDARFVLNLALQSSLSEADLGAETLLSTSLRLDLDAGVELEIHDATALGMTDWDHDTRPDIQDNCPQTTNPYQEDTDSDGVGDVCDVTATSD